MTTLKRSTSPDDQDKSSIDSSHLLRPPDESTSQIYKPFPRSILDSIEKDRRRSMYDFSQTQQSSIETTDDDLSNQDEIQKKRRSIFPNLRKRSLIVRQAKRSPSEIRITIDPDRIPDENSTSNTIYDNDLRASDPSLSDPKASKANRSNPLRRAVLERRIGRRLHSSFSSATTLVSSTRRRSAQNISFRSTRRHSHYLSRTSKWHFVRAHLHEIAMMNENYARMKIIERDLRWKNLREQICQQVLEMRDISILRKQDDGSSNEKSKIGFDLKSIPVDEVVHVERDGRVYSIATRDLFLGRLTDPVEVPLDFLTQLEARRRFRVKQDLLKRQEGRTRLKKIIASIFCFLNLFSIVLMFIFMFSYATKTLISRMSSEIGRV